MRYTYSIVIDIDRTLKLNLSNGQFKKIAAYLEQYDNPEQAAYFIMMCDRKDVLEFIDTLQIVLE